MDFYIKLFQTIEQLMTHDELQEFIGCSKEELICYHYGLGTWLRNRYFNHPSQYYNYFIAIGITHPDDMSQRVIEMFYDFKHRDKITPQ